MNRHRHPRPVFMIVMVIPLIVVLAIAAVVLARAIMDDDESLPTPEPPPGPTAPVASTITTPATSIASPENEPPAIVPGSLTSLMGYAPDRLQDGSLPLPEVATYTDIAAWLADQGAPAGVLTEDQAAELALPPILAGRGLDPVWRSTYGFSLADIGQILAIGQAPDYTLVMRGNFDPQALLAAWSSGGYQAVALDGFTIWSVYPDFQDTINLSIPASRPAMGSLNNLVLLEDGTLIAAAKLFRLQDVLDVVRGAAPSMAGQPDIASLLALETADRVFVSAVIAKGDLLEATPSDSRIGTADPGVIIAAATPDPPALAPVRMCLFGLMHDRIPEANGTPVATPAPAGPPEVTIALVLPDADSAAVAITTVPNRFAQELSPVNDVPYASLSTLRVGSAPALPTNVVVFLMLPHDAAFDWLEPIDDRDFAWLTWAEPQPLSER